MNSSLALLARCLLASIFLISGVRKILGFAAVSGMMAAKGFPMPNVVLVLTIVLEIGGGLLLVANRQARFAALALAAFTLAAGVTSTVSGTHGTDRRRNSSMSSTTS